MKIAPFIGRQDYEGALQLLEGELAGTADDSPYLEMIAHCHWLAGNDEKAIETAKEALELDPNNFEMPKILSQIYAEHEEHEQAVAYVKIGLRNYKSDSLPAVPRWVFGAMKLAAKYSARWKHVEEAAKEDLGDPNKDSREWCAWANEYLLWYEEALK